MRYSIAGLVLALACQAPTAADVTRSFAEANVTGTAGGSGGFIHSFVSPNAGDVGVRIRWDAKVNGLSGAIMRLRRLPTCTTEEMATSWYEIHSSDPSAPPMGDWIITSPLASATSGTECWEVRFQVNPSRKVRLNLTISTP